MYFPINYNWDSERWRIEFEISNILSCQLVILNTHIDAECYFCVVYIIINDYTSQRGWWSSSKKFWKSIFEWHPNLHFIIKTNINIVIFGPIWFAESFHVNPCFFFHVFFFFWKFSLIYNKIKLTKVVQCIHDFPSFIII